MYSYMLLLFLPLIIINPPFITIQFFILGLWLRFVL